MLLQVRERPAAFLASCGEENSALDTSEERPMSRSRILLLLALVAALALVACHPRPINPPAEGTTGATGALQGVEITSRLKGTIAGAGQVNLTLVGTAAHIQSGLSVRFTVKQLVAVDPGNFGPVTATLDPRRESVGTLSSRTFPMEHRQNFFLQIHSERLGTLVSDNPLTLSARIDSSPPTATYRSTGGDVQFYKEGDSSKKPVFTVQEVTSDVKPAASQAVDITSRVTARLADRQADLTFTGTAVHLLNGTNVLFISKTLVTTGPANLGRITINLDPRRPSVGTLDSPTLPALHRQSFFLRIQNERLGTLVSDDPVVVEARIESTPPKATYRSVGQPVEFYKQGDPGKKPVLTFEKVESDVTPAARPYR
jgi:hypothetical protein